MFLKFFSKYWFLRALFINHFYIVFNIWIIWIFLNFINRFVWSCQKYSFVSRDGVLGGHTCQEGRVARLQPVEVTWTAHPSHSSPIYDCSYASLSHSPLGVRCSWVRRMILPIYHLGAWYLCEANFWIIMQPPALSSGWVSSLDSHGLIRIPSPYLSW